MNERGIEALLVTHLPDVRYLCGFTGSNAALVVTPRRAALFTDGRYTVQAKEQTHSARVVIAKRSGRKSRTCTVVEPTRTIPLLGWTMEIEIV